MRSLLSAFCALLLLVGIPHSSVAADPYDIYVIASQSGVLSFIGKEHTDALTVFESVINQDGGVAGQPIHFVFMDDQTNPQVGVQLFNQLKAKNLPFILGSHASASCTAIFPLIRSGPVEYCFSTAVHAHAGTFEFHVLNTNYDQNVGGMRFLRARGLNRLALIAPTDTTGQTYEESIRSIIQAKEFKGMTLVTSEHFSSGDVSVAAQIARVRAAHVDALLLGTVGTNAGTVFRALVSDDLDIPVVAGFGITSLAFMKQYSAIIPRQFYAEGYLCNAPELIRDRRVRSAYQSFTSAMAAHSITADCLQSSAWDSASILISGLRKYGTSVTAQQMRTYIAGLADFAGINGIYNFKRVPQSGFDDGACVIVRWDAARSRWVGASKPGGQPL